MIDQGKKDELNELDKILLRAVCWVDNTMLLLPILAIGLISCDNPLLRLEAQEFKDIKKG
jgi:hypothetical protein